MAKVRLDKSDQSALAEHANTNSHNIDWNSTTILAQESRWAQRKWLEAWLISKNKNSLSNRDNGRIIPDNYKALLKSIHN